GELNKTAYGFELFRQLPTNFGSVGYVDVTQALVKEIETEKIGAGVDGGKGVGSIGDTANFNADHAHLQRSPRRSEERGKGRGGIRSEHEVRADEESVKTGGAKFHEIVMGAQAGFADGDAVIGSAA